MVSAHKTILISILIATFAAASPPAASAWNMVFEIRANSGQPAPETNFQALMDPQNSVTIGVELMGIRIGYDSRNGIAAVIEF